MLSGVCQQSVVAKSKLGSIGINYLGDQFGDSGQNGRCFGLWYCSAVVGKAMQVEEKHLFAAIWRQNRIFGDCWL